MTRNERNITENIAPAAKCHARCIYYLMYLWDQVLKFLMFGLKYLELLLATLQSCR